MYYRRPGSHFKWRTASRYAIAALAACLHVHVRVCKRAWYINSSSEENRTMRSYDRRRNRHRDGMCHDSCSRLTLFIPSARSYFLFFRSPPSWRITSSACHSIAGSLLWKREKNFERKLVLVANTLKSCKTEWRNRQHTRNHWMKSTKVWPVSRCCYQCYEELVFWCWVEK